MRLSYDNRNIFVVQAIKCCPKTWSCIGKFVLTYGHLDNCHFVDCHSILYTPRVHVTGKFMTVTYARNKISAFSSM